MEERLIDKDDERLIRIKKKQDEVDAEIGRASCRERV